MKPNKQAELDRLSDRIRQFWINEVRAFQRRTRGTDTGYKPSARYDGGRTANSATVHQPIWPKIAELVRASQLNPGAYVSAQFFERTKGPIPQPNILLSPSALSRYYAFVDNMPDTVLLDLQVQVEEFKRACTRTRTLYGDTSEAVDAALLDRGLCMSALLRYCIAFNEGLAVTAALWQEPALDQYNMRRSQYDEVWGECIPEHFRKS